eukprot:4677684-Pleurochrysis_carterae.AAC.1
MNLSSGARASRRRGTSTPSTFPRQYQRAGATGPTHTTDLPLVAAVGDTFWADVEAEKATSELKEIECGCYKHPSSCITILYVVGHNRGHGRCCGTCVRERAGDGKVGQQINIKQWAIIQWKSDLYIDHIY